MRRAKQPYSLTGLTVTLVVVSMIALVLLFSSAITSGAGHTFDQITLALPIFFVVLFLATTIGDSRLRPAATCALPKKTALGSLAPTSLPGNRGMEPARDLWVG